MNMHMRLFNFAGILFLCFTGIMISCGTSKETTQSETEQSRKIDSTTLDTQQERAPVAPAKKTRTAANPERTRQTPRPLETK
jgi:hypothetical protein